jgi:hypothetical protein
MGVNEFPERLKGVLPSPEVNVSWARPTARVATATPWMALFTLLLLAQVAHLGEHVAQMVQLHLLGLTGTDARGIVGRLDIEWVHFIWNAGVVVILGALLMHARSNTWLVTACVFAAWHLIEHDVIMLSFLATGIPGSPGLLASGGMILGGLPLARADLHFLYNAVEVAMIAIAFAWQLRAEGVAHPPSAP